MYLYYVRERSEKLRNLLTVMGCNFSAYWLGTFIGDFIIMSIPMVVMWYAVKSKFMYINIHICICFKDYLGSCWSLRLL